ncbi:phosphonoacetylaldehyde hydrolase [Proteus phage vB_PmiP_RS8pmA]|uniref:Phosphonoacetylaldehyde hydrolase n=1 Tax=Proteus phage vB_PmiP_RS8pmA TaxID=2250314 RepID=A0A514CY67_9CAUD|nr:phosphonoacetylaldehyde hydrolase [Proteus phage vB_PmiP_RS8pmA]
MNNTMNITTMGELLESYREFLDGCYSGITIASCTFEPSEVLEELDPVAFRQGYLDYADAVGIDVDELEDDL